ncbi:ankyrin [Exidia glandulosa HHB12029]|uniref:Ankyrin n=1 Tax=Exidia glandulosa HHB12029 TaxID=1314781 RepID=A0A166BL33_EXIGL|nr:ankyrin [Exidia glandulosa HHB12029]
MSQSDFDAAAQYLSSSPALSKVGNGVKLELYALFKAVTVSRRPESKRPSIFDMTGRAKWDAWDALGQKDADATVDTLRDRYIAKARQLGWTGETVASTSAPSEDAPIDWESEDLPPAAGPGSNNVSTMSNDAAEFDLNSLHGCVHAGDIDRLKTLITHAGVDLNAQDEFGFTPLHLAADRGSEEMVKLLLGHGADPSIKDPDGETALSLAQVSDHAAIIALLET